MSFEEYLTSLQGKTVGVIGVGVSNRPLIEKLLERGIDVTARRAASCGWAAVIWRISMRM